MSERKIDPEVQAAMDAAISPEARALLVELLRWPRLLAAHHDLYRDVVHGAAHAVMEEARAAEKEGRARQIMGAAHAIFEVFQAAAKGTPSEFEEPK